MYLKWCKKMYEIYCKLRDEKGLSDYKVAQDLGFSRSTFSQWKAGSSQPKRDKLQKIADYFGVSLEYLTTGETTSGYYYNEDAMQIAQEIYQNKDLHMLFDMTRDASADELRDFAEMIKLMQKRERYED